MSSATATPAVVLTKRQEEIFEFVKKRIVGGLPPTVREIGTEFGIRSPNGVMCHLKALEKKGLITRDPRTSRSIYLVENGELALEGSIESWESKTSRPTATDLVGAFNLDTLKEVAEKLGLDANQSKNNLAVAIVENGDTRFTATLTLAAD